MDLAQYHDTTITDCESGLSVRAIVVPASSMAPHARFGLLTWTAMLGLKTEAMLDREREIVAVLASLLRPRDLVATELATVLVREPRLPLGEVGMQFASLMMIAESNADNLEHTAFQVALGEWRMLAVVAPVGIVLASAAATLSGALDHGLYEKIRELMGLDGREFQSTGPAAIT